MTTKEDLRKRVAARRPNADTLKSLSPAVLNKLIQQDVFKTAQTVGLYMPLSDEVDVQSLFTTCAVSSEPVAGRTTQSLERATEHKLSAYREACPTKTNAPPSSSPKTFYIPAYDEVNNGYRLAKWVPELQPGKFGIPEPETPIWASADEVDLVLVPGIAFDQQGNRLGRGGGFYDRLLPLYTAVRIGIGFEFQCFEAIETEPHDCRLDALVTDQRYLKFS